MIRQIKAYLEFGQHFCGIEHTSINGEERIFSSLLKKSKNELNVEAQEASTSIENSIEKLPKKQHVLLIINNDKVLSKIIDSKQSDLSRLVYKAFPNIDLGNFYFEVLSQSNNHYISLCRKDYVDNIIETYKKNKISVISLSLGNTLIAVTKDFISTTKIQTSNAEVTIEDNQIKSIEKKDHLNIENYNINGLQVDNKYLLSTSGALQIAIQKNNKKTNFENEKSELLNDYKNLRFFNEFLKIAGVFILGLLLVNFLIFNHYFNEVNSLQQTSQLNQSTKLKINKLNASVNKTQKMVEDLLKSKSSKTSFYLNEVVQSIPNAVLLSDFDYQPLKQRIKENKPIELSSNTISISGVSNSNDDFLKWVRYLENKNWVLHSEIIKYSTDTNSKSDFSLKMTLDND